MGMESVLNFLRFLVEAPEGRVVLVLLVVLFGGIGILMFKQIQVLRQAIEGNAKQAEVFSDPRSPLLGVVTGLIATNTRQGEALDRVGEALDRVADGTEALRLQAGTTEVAMERQITALAALINRVENRFGTVNEQHTAQLAGLADLQGALKTLEENQAVMQQAVERLTVLCEEPDQAVVTCLEELDKKMCEVLAEIVRVRKVIEASSQ